MQYQVLVHMDKDVQKVMESIEQDVSKALSHGWVLQGGISCAVETRADSSVIRPQFIACQAIIKM